MDYSQGFSTQTFIPVGVNDGSSTEHHHHHHHRSHHQHVDPPPGEIVYDAPTPYSAPYPTLKARAVMTADSVLVAGGASKWNSIGHPAFPGQQPVYGVVNFEQTPQGVHITGYIEGLGQGTTHGFHVHEFGDVSAGCTTAGAHFNPFKRHHGGPHDAERHLGDLGNVTADAFGVAHLNILDSVISLHGEHSIVGRAIVVHAMPDDLGRGGNEESSKTGNAGGRLACGIIGYTKPQTY